MTSPVQNQRDFERAAISGLARHLRTLGHNVVELGHPEDDPSDPLNVDAVWRIDNEPWAVEHARIVYDPRAIPAEEAAERYLRPKLDTIAHKYGVWLQLGFYAPRWERGARLPTTAWESLVALAERAASTMTFSGDAKGNSVSVREGNPSVTFSFFASENAALGGQFKAALDEPLRAKLSGQLAIAKENGFRVLLLLDQMPAPRSDPGTMWTPEHGTLAQVVISVLDQYPDIVDRVWCRDGWGSYNVLVPE